MQSFFNGELAARLLGNFIKLIRMKLVPIFNWRFGCKRSKFLFGLANARTCACVHEYPTAKTMCQTYSAIVAAMRAHAQVSLFTQWRLGLEIITGDLSHSNSTSAQHKISDIRRSDKAKPDKITFPLFANRKGFPHRESGIFSNENRAHYWDNVTTIVRIYSHQWRIHCQPWPLVNRTPQKIH